MRELFCIFLSVSSVCFPAYGQECCQEFLESRIAKSDKRYSTFKYALSLLEERNAKVLVETGTARYGSKNCSGDGCSTLIFGNWAIAHGAKVFSVDIDRSAVGAAEIAVLIAFSKEEYLKGTIKIVCQDSVSFLNDFDRKIDFLYLDSYDVDLNNPYPSQEHHLKEIIAAYPHFSQNCIVMIDDCDLPFGGKGKLVIEYLLERGWTIAASEYQTILVKN